MAKKAWRERNKRKAETVKKYAAIRAELKAKRDYAGLAEAAAGMRVRRGSWNRLFDDRPAAGGNRRKFGCSRFDIPGGGFETD